MLKNNFINNIYCEELDTDIKSFLTAKQLKILKEHSTEGYVLQGMEFRPDKVAAYYLGDERLGWAISAASGFINGWKYDVNGTPEVLKDIPEVRQLSAACEIAAFSPAKRALYNRSVMREQDKKKTKPKK